MIPKTLKEWKASEKAKLEELSLEVQSLKKLLENKVGRSGGTSLRGYLNDNKKPKDSTLTASSAGTSGTIPSNANSVSGPPSSSPAPGVTVPKKESTPSRGLERSDRRAIPAWQMAAATTEKSSESAGSSRNAEAGTAEAGA